MRVTVSPHTFSGTVVIPASKSHTIRQLLIASLADGVSEIRSPLDSLDTRSCIAACRVMGAQIEEHYTDKTLCALTVRGNAGFRRGAGFPDNNSVPPLSSSCPPTPNQMVGLPPNSGNSSRLIDAGNSGTTLYLALAAAALDSEPIEFTGDEQLQRRSAAPLLEALASLGIRAESTRNNGCVPIIIQGPWKGGKVTLPCPTSQYLSALLLAAPLAPAGVTTEIEVPLLNERPYIEMTLSYLNAHNIPCQIASDFSSFTIPGGAAWKPFSRTVPADFSSAAFPAAAAAISGGTVTLTGLDPNDTQGDKFFFDILAQMGCVIEWRQVAQDNWQLNISRNGNLKGGTFDLNACPDLLPAAAVCAAFAEGDTSIVNVAHARIKETDRIAVMAAELAKLGVQCTEKPDGLIIHGKGGAGVSGGSINGHGDHRIVMAFACAATGAAAPIEIDTAESAAVTYPGFLELLDASA